MPESLKTFVNGPINVVRVEGKIGKVKKVIYLFMDIHMPTNQQTECDDVLSKDAKEYFVDKFREVDSNKMIDFFVETMPLNIQSHKSDEYKQNYILNVVKMMSKAFEKKGDRVVVNKLFPTIRFHHMDPRDYLEGNSYQQFQKLNNMMTTIWNSKQFFPDDHERISQILKSIDKDVQFVYHYLFKEDVSAFKNDIKKKPISPYTTAEFEAMTPQDYDVQTISLIKKIRARYNNKDVMNGVNSILKKYVKADFEEYFRMSKGVDQLFGKINKIILHPRQLNSNKNHASYGTEHNEQIRILAELEILIDDLYDLYLKCFVGVMDAYFLRRFLDKDYITNVVGYTGAMHSVNYIFYLVKLFGFKVTHYNYFIPNKDPNKEVMKATKPAELETMFYPPILKQCSDLTDFPKNFD